MPEYISWIVVIINIVVMLLGFATMRREQHRDAKTQVEVAVQNEHRLTAIESAIKELRNVLEHRGFVGRSIKNNG